METLAALSLLVWTQSLHCPSPKADSNTVRILDGDAEYHMGTNIQVTCNDGEHFAKGGNQINATCVPFPHPCMCMAGWQTIDDFMLIYDFNCTANDNTAAQPQLRSQLDPAHECPDPTPVNGALQVVSGTPFVISNVTVRIMCLHGLVFPDGTTEKIERCLPASTPIHVTGVWVPDFSVLTCSDPTPIVYSSTRQVSEGDRDPVQSYAKPNYGYNVVENNKAQDYPQCPDPTPVQGTVTVLFGRPYTDGCIVELKCYTGLVFYDGTNVWNLTCTPVPVPNTMFWVPQMEEKPTCRGDNECPDPTPVNGTLKIIRGHPYEYDCNVILTCYPGLEFPDGLSVWNLTCLAVPVPNTLIWAPVKDAKPICQDDPQCPDPTPVCGSMKIVRGKPYSYGCNVILTCDPGLVFPDGLSVWNLTCLAVPHPDVVIWVPVKESKPICGEPKSIPAEVDEKEEHEVPTNTDINRSGVHVNPVIRSVAMEQEEAQTTNQIEEEVEPDVKKDIHISQRNNIDQTAFKIEIAEEDEEEEKIAQTQIISNPGVQEIEINSEDVPKNKLFENIEESTNEVGQVENYLESETILEDIEYVSNSDDQESIQEEPVDDIHLQLDNENPEEETEIIEEAGEDEHAEGLESYEEEETSEGRENVEQVTEHENELAEGDEREDENEQEVSNESEMELEEYNTSEYQEEMAIEEVSNKYSEDQEENSEVIEAEEVPIQVEEEESNEGEEEEVFETSETTTEPIEIPNHIREQYVEAEEIEEDLESEEEQENEHNDFTAAEGGFFEEISPLQPPQLKHDDVIHSSVQESLEAGNKEEDEHEAGESETHTELLEHDEEVEPPGPLLDVQQEPVQETPVVQPPAENECLLPPKSGPCKAHFQRFFYNAKTKECESFVYGGCQGNRNNYETLQECMDVCGRIRL